MRRETIACLEWLRINRSSLSDEFCWGDPYEYATRGGQRPYGEPLLIWTALIGQAFLDAYELLWEDKYLQIAESTGRWILELPMEQTEPGNCLSYVLSSVLHSQLKYDGRGIPRSTPMAHRQPRCAHYRKNRDAVPVLRQRADGAWYYAEEAKYH